MELVAKLADAASMFWQSLDERERLLLLYLAGSLLLWLGAAVREQGRERLKRELREELAADAGPRSA